MNQRIPFAFLVVVVMATVTAFTVVALVTTHSVAAIGAPTASPSPTETVEPTATPAPGTYIAIEVVNDLNKDGVRQPEEPGVAGATLHVGCGDAFLQIPTTDSDGKTQARISAYMGRVNECILLKHEFGWLETTSPYLRFDFPEGEVHSALFLIHELGPDVMEVDGEAILAGVPAPDATIALAAPFGGCIERPAGPPFPLFVIVGATRSGCPTPGAPVQLVLDGSSAGSIAYAAGRVTQDVAARGDSMRLSGLSITAARIDGVDCAVIRDLAAAPLPPEYVRIFVLSDDIRPGCGAPGRVVRFYRGDVPLDPLVPWRAGDLPQFPDFVPSKAIVAPNAGGGSGDASTPVALGLAGLLMVVGSLLAGFGARRVSR